MVYTHDGGTVVVDIGICQPFLPASVCGLDDAGNADSVGYNTCIFDVFLQPLLYIMELAVDSIQSITCLMLEMAQVLGFALYGNITHLDDGNDGVGSLGTYLGGLEPYLASGGMDANRVETIEYN